MFNYNPYYTYTQTNYTPLVFVNGIEGAKAYIIPPNSTIYLRDSEKDIMYIKTSDREGKYTLRAFQMVEIIEKDKTKEEFITKEEFYKFKEEMEKTIKGGDKHEPNAIVNAIDV